MMKDFFDREWWKNLLVAIIATTVSIILTFGSASLFDLIQRKKDRKMTAMMVMSNIESFARNLDRIAETLERKDSVALWLLKLELEDMQLITEQQMVIILSEVQLIEPIQRDKTAETIFSGNIETWKNMGNYKFIDHVGTCFSTMNWIEHYWNGEVAKHNEAFEKVLTDSGGIFKGNLAEKLLTDWQVRTKLFTIHAYREWLAAAAAEIRSSNRNNMRLIGISEKDVLTFTDARTELIESDETFSQLDYALPYPDVSSLAPYSAQLDSLKR